MQLAQIAVAGTAAKKALLADVTAKNPDASYIELLRRFKVRRRRWVLEALVASKLCGIALPAHLLAAATAEPDLGCTLCSSAIRTGTVHSPPALICT